MSKIVDQPERYFRQFVPKRDELLVELEAEAERETIPISGPVVGELRDAGLPVPSGNDAVAWLFEGSDARVRWLAG